MALSESYKNRMKVLSGQKGTLIESARIDFLKNEFLERIGRKYDKFFTAFNNREWDVNTEKDALIKNLMSNDKLISRAKMKLIPKNTFLKNSLKIFTQLQNQDPSENKQYLKWLINIYLDGNLEEEDFYKIPETLNLFSKNKEKIPLDKRNINNYPNIASVYNTVFPFSKTDVLSNSEQQKLIKIEGAEQVFEDSDWKIIVPKTKEAACLYGKGTRWCTASKENNRFLQYHKDGPLYILINKKMDDDRNPHKKFQFHFDSNQFMDSLDRSIDVGSFFRTNVDLKNFFKKIKEITPAFEFDHMLISKEEGLKMLKHTEDKLELIKKRGFRFIKDFFNEMGASNEFQNSLLNDTELIKGLFNQDKTKELIQAYIENKQTIPGLNAIKNAPWLNDWILEIQDKSKIDRLIENLFLLGEGGRKFAAELCKYKGVVWQSCLKQGGAKIAQYFTIISNRITFGKAGIQMAQKMLENPTILSDIKKHGFSDTQIFMLKDFFSNNKQESEAQKYYKNLIA